MNALYTASKTSLGIWDIVFGRFSIAFMNPWNALLISLNSVSNPEPMVPRLLTIEPLIDANVAFNAFANPWASFRNFSKFDSMPLTKFSMSLPRVVKKPVIFP